VLLVGGVFGQVLDAQDGEWEAKAKSRMKNMELNGLERLIFPDTKRTIKTEREEEEDYGDTERLVRLEAKHYDQDGFHLYSVNGLEEKFFWYRTPF
jgi:hypothetical protein